MNQSRLFTFGCSFTQYVWPTWADILGREFDQFENWGSSAAGNQFIFNSLIECNLRNKLQKTDTVIIMWSNVTRLDRYYEYHWHLSGNLMHSVRGNSDEHVRFQDINDFRGFLIRDLAVIEAAIRLLDSIGCKYQFHSMVPITTVDIEKYDSSSNNNIDILELYQNTINKIKPSIYTTMYNNDWSSLPSVDLSYSYQYEYIASLNEFQENYNIIAGANWPTYDNFIKNKLSDINPDILDELLQFDLYNKYTSICNLNKKSKSMLTRIRNILSQTHNPADYHPLPNIHLSYIQKAMPEFNISAETIAWANMHHNAVINNEVIPFDRYRPNRL